MCHMYNGGNLADLYLKSDNVQNTFYEIPEGVFVYILFYLAWQLQV